MSFIWLRTTTCAAIVAAAVVVISASRLVAALAVGKPLPPDIVVTDISGHQKPLVSLLTGDARARLALIRVHAAWCGTCQWHAGWSGALLTQVGTRVRLIDVVIADEDNQPAMPETIRAWAAREGMGGAAIVVAAAADPFRALFPAPAPLPRVVIVDARDGTVLGLLANPDPETLVALVRQHLAGAGRAPASTTAAAPAAGRIDGLFTRDQWALIAGMRWSSAPLPDPTNRVADDPKAAALGETLFSDATLSFGGRSCAACHNPSLLFTNGKDVAAEGAGPGSRNVPTILAASHARWLLWDGRVDSLWAQATMPIEDAEEMGSSRLFLAHAVHQRHRPAYEALFGPLPALEDEHRFPVEGKPGDPRWERMNADDREAVTRILANVGKAIAAFERRVTTTVQPNALDRYAAGDREALTRPEKEGLAAFFEAGCAQCHYGPRLSDDAFHALRFPTGRYDGRADRGRIDGIPRLIADEFSRAGRFSDAPLSPHRPHPSPSAIGAFRTPSLRGVASTMPYGHGGGFAGLALVIEAHRKGGLPLNNRYAVGETEPWAQDFDPRLTEKMLPFLQVLRMDVAPRSQ